MFKSINDILDFAIEKEVDARDYYLELTRRMEKPETQELFKHLAEQEQAHYERLKKLRRHGFPKLQSEFTGNFNLIYGNVTDDNTSIADLAYQNALMLAIEREESSYKFYSRLADVINDTGLGEIFSNLAHEEAQHLKHLKQEFEKKVALL